MELGKRIKQLRMKRNITQSQLGKIVGKTQIPISLYESGQRNPDPKTIEKFAEYFDVSIDYLFGRTDDVCGEKVVRKDMKQILEDNELNWDGIPLSENDLRPIRDLLELVVKERLPKQKKYVRESNDQISLNLENDL